MSDDRPAALITDPDEQVRRFAENFAPTAPDVTPEASERDNTTGTKE